MIDTYLNFIMRKNHCNATVRFEVQSRKYVKEKNH